MAIVRMEFLRSVALLCPEAGSHLVGDFVVFEEVFVMGKFHGFALDDDEVNAFGSIFEEFRSMRDLLVVLASGRQDTIEGFHGFERLDHFFACGEVGRGCLVPDFNCQRVVWIIEEHQL